MPMRYANEDDVLEQLEDMSSGDPGYDGLVRLENALCDVFDHKVGTSFGVAAVAETRTVVVGDGRDSTFFRGFVYAYIVPLVYSPIISDFPIRSVTGITTGGTWDGAEWTDTTALSPDEYRLTYTTRDGVSYGIERVTGYWLGTVHITGTWSDQPTEDVPDDVCQTLTELTVKEWHRRHASPSGEVGPEGLSVRPGNPWNLEYVKSTIDRYTVVEVLV